MTRIVQVIFISICAASALQAAPVKLPKFVRDELLKKGRGQAAELLDIFSKKVEAWQNHPEQTWPQFVALWEREVLEQDPATYKEAQIAALWAAKSPAFGAELVEFLTERGAMRFRRLDTPLEKLRDTLRGARSPALGWLARRAAALEVFRPSVKRAALEWVPHLRLPRAPAYDPDKCEAGLVDVAAAVFEGNNSKPEPHAWLKAFRRVHGWGQIGAVSVAEYERFYGRRRALMRQVAQEVGGLSRQDAASLADATRTFRSPMLPVIRFLNKSNLDITFEGRDAHRVGIEKKALKWEMVARGIFTAAFVGYAVPKLYQRQKHKERVEEFEKRPVVENEKSGEKYGENEVFRGDQHAMDELTRRLSELREQGKTDPSLERQIQELQKKLEGGYESDDSDIHP